MCMYMYIIHQITKAIVKKYVKRLKRTKQGEYNNARVVLMDFKSLTSICDIRIYERVRTK